MYKNKWTDMEHKDQIFYNFSIIQKEVIQLYDKKHFSKWTIRPHTIYVYVYT
jgi:hypothetical protein